MNETLFFVDTNLYPFIFKDLLAGQEKTLTEGEYPHRQSTTKNPQFF